MHRTGLADTARGAGAAPGARVQRACACGKHTPAGGQCATCARGALAVQRKLSVGASDDALELEADRVADHVLALPAPTAEPTTPDARPDSPTMPSQAGRAMGARPPPRLSRLRAAQAGDAGAGAMAAPASVDTALAGAGQPLAPRLRHDMEGRFGQDFSAVRLHAGAAAAESAREVGARAYTVGSHIVFGAGAPSSASGAGRRLLAHELAHVVQQGQSGCALRRAVTPEDVAGEMAGREFELAEAFRIGAVTLAKGRRVTILSWKNDEPTATIFPPLDAGGFALILPPPDIPKTLLRPVRPGGAKLAPYSAGIGAQAAAVEKNEAELVGKTGSEKTRLEGLLATRRSVLNRKLIQETMYNRFDPVIKAEVDTANAARGFKGADALDPDLVKAMIFQESEMGTAGAHLELVPTHPVKTRFNLGQVIDSSGMALLTMLEREQPALITRFSLGSLRADLAAAQAEKKALEAKASPGPADVSRLAQLVALSDASWEAFIWSYKAAGKPEGFAAAVDAFFASTVPARNVDYGFWIHMMVLWLFEKKTKGRSWLDTIKAYNGSGKRAEHYRKAVQTRASGAEAAEAAGKSFTPTR
ncbi:MAG: DUF4157 domain-containing protein [Pseudomonadota bacterium]